jgi:hypothetical protein
MGKPHPLAVACSWCNPPHVLIRELIRRSQVGLGLRQRIRIPTSNFMLSRPCLRPDFRGWGSMRFSYTRMHLHQRLTAAFIQQRFLGE